MDADGTPLAVLFADISGSTSLYEKLGNSQALRMVAMANPGQILTGRGQSVLGQSVADSGEEIITYEVA